MSAQTLTPLILIAALPSGNLALQACNTVAGIGRGDSAGADAVTGSAEDNKNY